MNHGRLEVILRGYFSDRLLIYRIIYYIFGSKLMAGEEQPDLNDMKFFVAVVQAGSLSRAAEQLCVPKSKLSRRLTQLEQALGSRLVDRGRSGVRLNELGERFYHHAVMMLDCADQAVNSVRQSLSEPQGGLRVSVSIEIMRSYLEPRLADYMRRYPKVALDVQVDNRRINMIQDGVDVALRIGVPDQDEVVARLAGHLSSGLYAAPEYLVNAPPLREPADLADHVLLHKTDGISWRLLANGQAPVEMAAKKRVGSNSAYLLAQLAVDGQGVALLPEVGRLVPPQLVRVLPEWSPETVPLYVVYYKNRGFAPSVRSFVDWFLAQFGR